MGDVKDLLVGIATLVGSLSAAFVLIWNTVKGPRRNNNEKVARKAATETADKLLDAVADGEITPEEIDEIKKSLRREEP